MSEDSVRSAEIADESTSETTTSHGRLVAREPTKLLRILDRVATPLGLLTLRERWSLTLNGYVQEMTLDNKLVMSSATPQSEQALANLALATLSETRWKILIGGLGLGFTALAALADSRTESVYVIERLPNVVGWYADGLTPELARLRDDKRLQVINDDFFSYVHAAADSGRRFDAILIDIDDMPNDTWHSAHQDFYDVRGLAAARDLLSPGGTFALWCAIQPEEEFMRVAQAVFSYVAAAPVRYVNPCHEIEEEHYLVLARRE